MNNLNNPLSFNPKVPKLQVEQRKQRNYQHLKPVYEVMNWKNYTMARPRNISVEEVDRLSAKNSIRQHHSPSYYQHEQHESNGVSHLSQRKTRQQNLRLSNVSYNNRQVQANRMKQDTIRRVKMLQEKVLPLISNQKSGFQEKNQDCGFAWQLKMQQKLVKIQNSIQNIKNQIQIKFQRRMIEIQRQWEERIEDLLDIVENRNQDMNGQENGHDHTNQQYDQQQRNQRLHVQQTNRVKLQKHTNQYTYHRSGFEDQNGNMKKQPTRVN